MCTEESCDAAARAGDCKQYFSAADQCLAASPVATALCSPSSYATFGDWMQGVGTQYCG
jgi:hypothetical protein